MWVLITLKKRETEADTRWIHVEKDEKMTDEKKKKVHELLSLVIKNTSLVDITFFFFFFLAHGER